MQGSIHDIPTLAQEMTTPPQSSTSRGEKAFNLLTYGGAAGIGTFIATIPVGYWAKYGGGAKHFTNATKFLTKQGLSPQVAEEMVNTSALMQGGNLMIIPVKFLEDNKPHIVDKLNDLLGDKSGAKSVHEDPKQSWMSLIKSRLVAWGAVFTGFRLGAIAVGGEKLQSFEKMFGRAACKVLNKPTHMGVVETPHFRYGKIAALDVFATAAASMLLYVGSRFFAKSNPHWHVDNVEGQSSNTETNKQAETIVSVEPAHAQSQSTHFRDAVSQPAKSSIRPKAQQGYQQAISTQRQSDENPTPMLSA